MGVSGSKFSGSDQEELLLPDDDDLLEDSTDSIETDLESGSTKSTLRLRESPTPAKRKQNNDDDDDDDDGGGGRGDVDGGGGRGDVDEDEDERELSQLPQEDNIEDERATAALTFRRQQAEASTPLIPLSAQSQAFYDNADDLDEETALEFMQTHEKDIFIVRRHEFPNAMFVVALSNTPLVQYCEHLAKLEKEAERNIRSLKPASFPVNTSDEVLSDSVPGVLARIVCEVLHEPANFMVPLDDGTRTRIMKNDVDPVRPHPEGVNLPLSSAPLQIFDPVDPDYAARLDAARQMETTPSNLIGNKLEEIDVRFKKNHLDRFSRTGDCLPFAEQPTHGFTGTSPVAEDEEWCVVNLHYYMSWRAFERVCEGNGNLMMQINNRLGSIGEDVFFFARKMDKRQTAYTPRVEHEVLERILETYKSTLKIEGEIQQAHLQIKNQAEVAASQLTERTVSCLRSALGREATAEQLEALAVLSDTASSLGKLQKHLQQLDELRAQRSLQYN